MTVAIEAMNFRKAVYVGDLVSVHANLVRIGRTSITVHLEAWVLRRKEVQSILVTDGNFTYVSIDDQGHAQAIRFNDRHDCDVRCVALASCLSLRCHHPRKAGDPVFQRRSVMEPRDRNVVGTPHSRFCQV